MKRIIKLVSVTLILATVVLSTSSCGLLAAGLFDTILNGDTSSNEEALSTEAEFYKLVGETKLLLDEVSNNVALYWYESLYENKHGGDAEDAIDKAMAENEEKIALIHENDTRIIELYRTMVDDYSDMEYAAADVMGSYNAYFSSVLEVGGKTYEFYSSSTQNCMLTLSVSLRNYYVEL